MTKRVNSVTITFDKDIRIDDFEETYVVALGRMKGVVNVTPNVSSIESHVAYSRASRDLQSKL